MDDPVLVRPTLELGGVVPEGLEGARQDGRPDPAQQHPARIRDRHGDPHLLQDRGRHCPQHPVARVVDHVHRVGSGGVQQGGGVERAVGVLTQPELGEGLLTGGPGGVGGRRGEVHAPLSTGGCAEHPEVVVRRDRRISDPGSAHDRERGHERGPSHHGHPHHPGVRGQPRQDVVGAQRQPPVALRDRLRDQQGQPGQQGVQVRQVLIQQLVHRGHPHPVPVTGERAVQQHAQGLRLAVAVHGEQGLVRELAQPVEVPVVGAAALVLRVESQLSHGGPPCPRVVGQCLRGAPRSRRGHGACAAEKTPRGGRRAPSAP